MSALVLVALALGLSNFAASIGIGLSGVDARARLRVGLVFGLFETGMPILGLVLGRSAAAALGSQTRWVGAGLLIATGVYGLVQSQRGGEAGGDGEVGGDSEQAGSSARQPLGRLLVTGLALSVDNLAVGFALGAYKVNVLVAAVVIGAVSIGLSLLGLELGARIGAAAGRRGEVIGAVVLIAVGVAIAAGLF
ncbi:manganese efflux pump [Actinospica durhamensis]|uniref:Manganese efflux pump n=1 Tax=Actinospica durhamensis TaxID=1508375 RepID=A0A941INX4_9ACTN|nr:manganese efflux pump [Actinospica durhamensis]MBR7834464.1 manganese efflux pump [Actinospica durhamensis]